MAYQGVQVQLSLAYDPQNDGQTKSLIEVWKLI